jgi:hypothetical protein
MATTYVTVKGYIKDGQVQIDLPENVTDGEIEVRVPVETEPNTSPQEVLTLTDEELDALMKPNPKTGAEIIALGHTGGWKDKGITDSVEWVLEQRRKRREKRGW